MDWTDRREVVVVDGSWRRAGIFMELGLMIPMAGVGLRSGSAILE